MFYGFEMALYLALVTNMFQFVWWKAKMDHAMRPYVRLTALGGVMAVMYPVAIYMVYVGHVGYPESKLWTGGAKWPNQPHGIVLLALRFLGLFLLGYCIMQVMGMPEKIRARWRALRKQPEGMGP